MEQEKRNLKAEAEVMIEWFEEKFAGCDFVEKE